MDDPIIHILKRCCDRDFTNETPYQVAVIVSNAMFWRNEEIRRLRDKIAFLVRPLTDDEDFA